MLKDGPAVSEITGGAIADLSTWKTSQQDLINRKVKVPGFIPSFFSYQEKGSHRIENPHILLAAKAFPVLTC